MRVINNLKAHLLVRQIVMLVIGQIILGLVALPITSYTTPATTFIVMGIVFAVSSLFLICSTITNQINDHINEIMGAGNKKMQNKEG